MLHRYIFVSHGFHLVFPCQQYLIQRLAHVYLSAGNLRFLLEQLLYLGQKGIFIDIHLLQKT